MDLCVPSRRCQTNKRVDFFELLWQFLDWLKTRERRSVFPIERNPFGSVRYDPKGGRNRTGPTDFATLLWIGSMTAAAEPPATKPVVHSFPSDLVEAEAAQRAKEDIRRKVEAELVAALASLETAKNAKSFGGSDKENSETGGDSTKLKDELARTKEELNGCRFLLRDAQNALADEASKTEQANKAADRWEGEASKLRDELASVRDELASVRDELDKARVATAAAQGFVKRHQEMQRKQQQAAEMVRQAEELKLAVERQAATVEPPSAEVPEEPSAPVEENMRHPPPPPRSPARAAPKPGEDAFPKVDVEKVKLAREVAKQTQEALRAQEAAIEQINKLVVENARLGKELAEEKKKTGALENIGQNIGQAFKGWWG